MWNVYDNSAHRIVCSSWQSTSGYGWICTRIDDGVQEGIEMIESVWSPVVMGIMIAIGSIGIFMGIWDTFIAKELMLAHCLDFV
jgi:pyruvate kinase